MGKLSHTWSLMGASWDVLKQDKEILIFPIISFVCSDSIGASSDFSGGGLPLCA